MVFSSSGDCNSPFGAATLGISQLVQKNCSPRMRQMPHFLTKIPVSRQIRLVFWGRNWQFFSISRLLLPDPETTSLVGIESALLAGQKEIHQSTEKKRIRDVRLVVCPTTELQKKSAFFIENAPIWKVKLSEFGEEILRKVRKNGFSKKP